MRKYLKGMLITSIMSSVLVSNVAKATDGTEKSSDRYAYVGVNFGLSEPIVKSFKHTDFTTNKDTMIRLKQSHMYGVNVGYSFYPGMLVEFSTTYQPKYRMAYRLPEFVSPLTGAQVPETPGTTGVTSDVFMINFIYEMQKMTSLQIEPYVVFGAGVARISIKPTTSSFSAALPVIGNTDVPFFKIRKTSQNCFGWQVGGGVSRDLTDNFSVDFGAKMQVVHDIKIKYKELSGVELTPTGINFLHKNAKPIKKTIAVGEFTMGLTYKFPL
jgi:opacity protein-like surface antigen